MLFAFALDPTLFFGNLLVIRLNEGTLSNDLFRDVPFYLSDVSVVVASAGLWWVARNRRISATGLYRLGLLYEVAICFVIAIRTYWEYYRDTGMLPNLTWVPAVVILFPLIMPAPPRLMLATAVAAALMSPLALAMLDYSNEVVVDVSAYVNTTLVSFIAVGFAYMGARVVYKLGREVAAARELGSYRLEERLGQGGMGEVWRARHRMLARPAAIKLIRTPAGASGRSRVSNDLMRRFEREAQVIARLRSPHTVDLFDFGVADNGAFYYVMELLEGLDADTLVRRFGPLPPERVIYVLTQICHSLSEAESCGLIHRDIKPANIFLCRYGEDCDFAKVLDFGLVKAFDDREAEPALTRENMVNGTPAFIAPEQAMGRLDIDGRVDIYATGCVAYWLLTGRLVFSAETPMGYLMHHIHTPPPSPSAIAELPMPEALNTLILSCLAKDPDSRPQSAKELSHKLAQIEISNPWTESRARSWWDRHQPVQPRTEEPASVPELVASGIH
jgi:serine/threonine-protein kinase